MPERIGRGFWRSIGLGFSWIWFVIAEVFFWRWYRLFTGADPTPPNPDPDANSLWD